MSMPGEMDFIERLRRLIPSGADVHTGIGDDAAVLPGRRGMHTLLTTDMLVEGNHFFPGADPYALGRKALAVNVSDIAAMGGYPTFAVISLGVPDAMTMAAAEKLYTGFRDECLRHNMTIVGGDTVRSDLFTINVALLGEVEHERLLLRKGALVGDKLCVTGRLGDAAAGLVLKQRPELDVPFAVRQRLGLAHERPVARVEAGRDLGRGFATSAIDVSDGVAGDARLLCRLSGVGAIIDADALPLSDDMRLVCAAAGVDATAMALSGGEDYELLFTTGRYAGRDTLPQSHTRYTVIGEIVPASEGVSLRRNGEQIEPLEGDGYRHF